MTENKKHYTANFYSGQMNESLLSAQEMVPYIIRMLQPKSVLDVGCGIGTWSSVFQQNGVTDVLGVDGEYVNMQQLLIPSNNFKSVDLRKSLDLGRQFNIAISLEVIEHLEDNEGKELVSSLVKHAPIIVFSGAVPLQGGTNHINEQWQSYWATEFGKQGYLPYDMLRPVFWSNDKVNNCYKQNVVVYVKKGITLPPSLQNISQVQNLRDLDLIHPDAWISRNQYMQINLKSIAGHYIRPYKTLLKKLLGR
jgi:SAM-dependent methyltransferase